MAENGQGTTDDPLVGTTLEGKYAIEKKLGEGGMGAVYIGEHLMMKRRVAIKTLLPQFTKNDNAVQRFQREAQAASAIGHPNIVTIHDLGQTADGMLYIVMELLDGRDLGQELRALKKEGWVRMPPERALAIMEQAGEGLAAAHEKGVVHRDLKPDNIFLTKGRDGMDRVKLLDFGISKIRSPSPDQARLTTDGSLLGTPYYMSPEQAQGKSDIDHRADIYAYGVILYELMTGHVPFEDDNMLRVIAMHAMEEPVPPRQRNPEVSAEMEALILRAMAKDPAARFQTMNDVLMALRAVRTGEPTAAGFAAVSTGSASLPGALPTPNPNEASWNGNTPPPVTGPGTGASWGGQGSGSMPGVSTSTPMSWSGTETQPKSSSGLKIALGVVALLFVIGAVVGLVVAFSGGDEGSSPPVVASPTPTPTPTPTGQNPYPTPTPTGQNPYPTPTPTGQNPYPTPTPTGQTYPTPTPTGQNPYPTPTPTPGSTTPVNPTGTVTSPPTVNGTGTQPTPTPTKVAIRITSTPSRAKVYDGDSLLGETPLALSLDRSSEERRLVLKARGYRDHRLTFVPNRDLDLDATLRRVRSGSRHHDRGTNRGGSRGGSSGGSRSNGLLKQMPTF